MNAFDNNSALEPWEDEDVQAVKRKEEEEEKLKEKRSSRREKKAECEGVALERRERRGE